MEFWISLAIPLTLFPAIIYFFKRLEFTAPLLLNIPLVVGIYLLAYNSSISDTEYLSDLVSQVEFREKWVEEYDVYVPEQGYTDSKGNYQVTVPAHTETVTNYHPEHWIKTTSSGKKFASSRQEYNEVKSKWKNNKYVDLHHSNQRHGWFCPRGKQCNCKDGRGDAYISTWNYDDSMIESATWTNTYKNKLTNSNSVFKFPEISQEEAKELGLYDLPKPTPNNNNPSILGGSFLGNYRSANVLLNQWNAKIGPRPGPHKDYLRAGHIWLLVFDDIAKAIEQENYWQGGNKNEFVVCVSLNKEHQISGGYVFSWTKNEKLKSEIRQFITQRTGGQIDLLEMVDHIGRECYDKYERREFVEFEYINIDVPPEYTLLNYILVVLLNSAIIVLEKYKFVSPT